MTEQEQIHIADGTVKIGDHVYYYSYAESKILHEEIESYESTTFCDQKTDLSMTSDHAHQMRCFLSEGSCRQDAIQRFRRKIASDRDHLLSLAAEVARFESRLAALGDAQQIVR